LCNALSDDEILLLERCHKPTKSISPPVGRELDDEAEEESKDSKAEGSDVHTQCEWGAAENSSRERIGHDSVLEVEYAKEDDWEEPVCVQAPENVQLALVLGSNHSAVDQVERVH